MNDLSAAEKLAMENATEAKHRAVFEAWQRKNREQEALSAAKWRKIALVLLPILFLVVTVTWYFRA